MLTICKIIIIKRGGIVFIVFICSFFKTKVFTPKKNKIEQMINQLKKKNETDRTINWNSQKKKMPRLRDKLNLLHTDEDIMNKIQR